MKIDEAAEELCLSLAHYPWCYDYGIEYDGKRCIVIWSFVISEDVLSKVPSSYNGFGVMVAVKYSSELIVSYLKANLPLSLKIENGKVTIQGKRGRIVFSFVMALQEIVDLMSSNGIRHQVTNNVLITMN